MYCYKEINASDELVTLLTYNQVPNITNPLIIEITEEEYNIILSEILAKNDLVSRLYNCEITIDDVPEKWQEEIQHRVDELIALNGESYNPDEATVEDYQDALSEFGVKV